MVTKSKVTKSVKSPKAQPNSLHLKVPEGIRFKEMVLDGLLIPGRLNDKEAYAPLDFTSISNRDVGRQHSYWAVRHAHLIFLVGNLRAEIGNLKYDLKNAEAKWMIKHSEKFKNKWQADHAMGRSKAVKRLRGRLVKAEASLTRYDGLAASYEGLRNAASREIARRSDERASRDL